MSRSVSFLLQEFWFNKYFFLCQEARMAAKLLEKKFGIKDVSWDNFPFQYFELWQVVSWDHFLLSFIILNCVLVVHCMWLEMFYFSMSGMWPRLWVETIFFFQCLELCPGCALDEINGHGQWREAELQGVQPVPQRVPQDHSGRQRRGGKVILSELKMSTICFRPMTANCCKKVANKYEVNFCFCLENSISFERRESEGCPHI